MRWQWLRPIAQGYLLLIGAAALAGPALSPVGYAEQNRQAISEPVSMSHLLGTDDLGRDRMARLLDGMRVSLLLAPVSAMIPVSVAALAGVWAEWRGGWWDRSLDGASNLFLCLPGFLC